jgi:hypothetical protein
VTLHVTWCNRMLKYKFADKDFNKILRESHKVRFGTFRPTFAFNPRNVIVKRRERNESSVTEEKN